MRAVKEGVERTDAILEDVTGGYDSRDPGEFFQYRFNFTQGESEEIKKKLGKMLTPNREYTRGELNKILGCSCSDGREMKNYLCKKLGLRDSGKR